MAVQKTGCSVEGLFSGAIVQPSLPEVQCALVSTLYARISKKCGRVRKKNVQNCECY